MDLLIHLASSISCCYNLFKFCKFISKNDDENVYLCPLELTKEEKYGMIRKNNIQYRDYEEKIHQQIKKKYYGENCVMSMKILREMLTIVYFLSYGNNRMKFEHFFENKLPESLIYYYEHINKKITNGNKISMHNEIIHNDDLLNKIVKNVKKCKDQKYINYYLEYKSEFKNKFISITEEYVEFMFCKNEFSCMKNNTCFGVNIKCEGQFSILFLTNKRNEILREYEIQEIINNMKNSVINLKIPKFSCETEIDLLKILPIIGINEKITFESANCNVKITINNYSDKCDVDVVYDNICEWYVFDKPFNYYLIFIPTNEVICEGIYNVFEKIITI